MLNHHFSNSSQPTSSIVTQKECIPVDQEKSEKARNENLEVINTVNVIILYKLASSQLSQFQVTPKAVVPKHWNCLELLISGLNHSQI